MKNEKYRPHIIAGAAVGAAAIIAGILGTIAAIARPRSRSNRKIHGWREHARKVAIDLFRKKDAVNKGKIFGGIAGSLIGVATAILLAPKAGSDLMRDLAHLFTHKKRFGREGKIKIAKKISKSKKTVPAKTKHKEHKAVKKGSRQLRSKKSARRRNSKVDKTLQEHIKEAAKVS